MSVARYAFDGVEVFDGKIYFVGGYDTSAKNTAEGMTPQSTHGKQFLPYLLKGGVLHQQF